MSSLKLYSFKFDSEDVRQLDALVESAKQKNADIAWGMSFNRSTILRNLIRVTYVEVVRLQEEVDSTIARAKKRSSKGAKAPKKSPKSVPASK